MSDIPGDDEGSADFERAVDDLCREAETTEEIRLLTSLLPALRQALAQSYIEGLNHGRQERAKKNDDTH